MAVTTDTRGKALAVSSRLPGGRLYDAAELLTWVATLNLAILVFTALGAVVAGLAPALVAAASVSRARLRGEAQPLLRTFARVWREEFRPANLLLAPFGVGALLLGVNLLALASDGGALVVAMWVALGLVVLSAMFATTMYVHYDLPLRRYATTAVRYLPHDLPATALVAAVTVLAAVLTAVLPGLLAVVSIGAWVYAVCGICLSCYARNDELVAAASTTHE